MIFATTNQKGGVGKTTTVLNLGSYLASLGYRVLLIDIDPQANLTSGLGINLREVKEKPTVYDVLIKNTDILSAVIKTRIPNLDLLPSEIELAGAEIEMVGAFSRENILKKAIDSVVDQYDLIFIDCPPSLGLLTINGLVAAQKVLIPVQAEYFALEGLGQLINTINLVKTNLNPNLEIGGVIITMFDNRTNLSKDVKQEIESFFDKKMFKTVIPRNIKLSEAPSHGLSIQEYDPNSTGAESYKKLAKELIKKFEIKKI
ncbi:MAG: sporulation initiation inhibitor protein Soj [Candidatus Dojkabacteria bacterium]|nr:MAG: sporulation initiation inhibitor protein Soj [Candidatus Dojkabacteria bacterium]